MKKFNVSRVQRKAGEDTANLCRPKSPAKKNWLKRLLSTPLSLCTYVSEILFPCQDTEPKLFEANFNQFKRPIPFETDGVVIGQSPHQDC